MNPNLTQLGVTEATLSPAEKDFLSQNGYLNLGQLLSPEQLESIRARTGFLLQKEGQAAGAELLDSPYIRHPKEEGADRLADLVNKGEEFDIFYTHPKVLAAMAQVLGEDFKLSSLNYRAAKPGKGLQKRPTSAGGSKTVYSRDDPAAVTGGGLEDIGRMRA